MDFYVVADEDTVLGFRYAGIPGVIVNTEAEAAREFDRLAESEAELILITTEQVADTVRERVNAIRFKAALPVIVEIPGPEGSCETSPSLLGMIREAVGIKI